MIRWYVRHGVLNHGVLSLKSTRPRGTCAFVYLRSHTEVRARARVHKTARARGREEKGTASMCHAWCTNVSMCHVSLRVEQEKAWKLALEADPAHYPSVAAYSNRLLQIHQYAAAVKDLKVCSVVIWCVMHHVSCVMCHVSCVVYGVACVMCHVWCVICHVSCVMYGVSCMVCDVSRVM